MRRSPCSDPVLGRTGNIRNPADVPSVRSLKTWNSQFLLFNFVSSTRVGDCVIWLDVASCNESRKRFRLYDFFLYFHKIQFFRSVKTLYIETFFFSHWIVSQVTFNLNCKMWFGVTEGSFTHTPPMIKVSVYFIVVKFFLVVFWPKVAVCYLKPLPWLTSQRSTMTDSLPDISNCEVSWL